MAARAPLTTWPSGKTICTDFPKFSGAICGNCAPTCWDGAYSTRSPVTVLEYSIQIRQNAHLPSKINSGDMLKPVLHCFIFRVADRIQLALAAKRLARLAQRAPMVNDLV